MAAINDALRTWHTSLSISYPTGVAVLAALGVLVILVPILSAFKLFIQLAFVPGTNLKKFGAGQGAWAVITGCTDGIGREFALQLAKAGFNVVLLSRTESKLKALATEIESKFAVQTLHCAIDYSIHDNKAGYAAVESVLSGIRIGVLVNNVGMPASVFANFDETPAEDIDGILEVNIRATTCMTRIVLPNMLQRKNGLILNIGSFSGVVPSPMIATYSASKAFISSWSQSLAAEYKPLGVTIQNVCASYVVSKLAVIDRPSMMVPMPKPYVECVLAKIGVPCGAIDCTATSNPYWSHAIMGWVHTIVPLPSLWITISHHLQKRGQKETQKVR
ncbi:hypothetical protein FRB95_011641 [Tulasnella sp. JGI-2019a]|nr:hypothetical protein FRB95_011641 [Tulasnella sp. JGI-2019a]